VSLYVALEGIEGTGKSTLLAPLAAALSADGQEIVTVREPGSTPAAEAIRHVLLSSEYHVEPWAEALLFAAQRSQLAAEVIRPALARGAVVIGDRSVYSSLAYQGCGRGLGVERVRDVNEAGLGGTWPDLVVLLEIDAADGLAREDAADRISSEGLDLVSRVATAFDDLAAAEPERFVRIDAGQPLDDVIEDALRHIRSRI
jgi:dTMP kinase